MQNRVILLLANLILLNSCSDPAKKEADKKNASTEQVTPIENVASTPYDLALQYAENGDDRVIALCDSLLTYDSAQAGASPYYYMGIYFAAKKEYKKSLDFFDRTIVADYRFLDAYIEKAALYHELKKPALALQELELLRSIAPSYAPVHYWIAKVAESQGEKEKALQHYKLSLSLDSTLMEARAGIMRLEK